MAVPAHKLSFREAWETILVFFVDEDLEQEIDQDVERLLKVAGRYGITETPVASPASLAASLREREETLEFVLREIELSQEKFLRIVSLLRKIGRIPVPLDKEWSMKQVAQRIQKDQDFASLIAHLLMDGCRDSELQPLIPRYYLETLNFREVAASSEIVRRIRYKRALIGTYSGRKGYRVEGRIKGYLAGVQEKYGVGFEQGRSRFIDTDIDFAIPSLDDPWVIVMVSFSRDDQQCAEHQGPGYALGLRTDFPFQHPIWRKQGVCQFRRRRGLVGQEERPPAPGRKLPLFYQSVLPGHVGIYYSNPHPEKVLQGVKGSSYSTPQFAYLQ